MNIEEIVDGIVNELRLHSNLENNTIEHYEKHSLKHLVNYFHSKNESDYDEQLLQDYLNDAIQKERNNQIKPRRLREVKRIVFMVERFIEGEDFLQNRSPNTKLYVPNSKHNLFIQEFNGSINYTGSTLENMQFFLRVFLTKLDSMDIEIEELTTDIYHEIFFEMYKTYHKGVNSLHLFYKNLHVCLIKHTTSNLIDPCCITIRRKYSPLIEPYSIEEINKMITVSKSILSKRDLAIFFLSITTGIRACDIINLKITSINWKDKYLKFIQSKTGNELRIPVRDDVLTMIADYIMNERPQPDNECDKNIVFLTSQATKKRFERTSSLDDITFKLENASSIKHINRRNFHSFRRFFATYLIDKDVELATVSQLLGHKDLSTDKRYISFNQNKVKKCAKGFEKIPVKGGVYYVE